MTMALLASTSDETTNTNNDLPNSFPGSKLNRKLAAPNQTQTADQATTSSNVGGGADFSNGRYTAGANNFPYLLPFNEIRKRKKEYVGPTNESNWVMPGHLLVGAYPGVVDDEENMTTIWGILNCKVTTFVCLQVEYPGPEVTEDMWRSGRAIRPYFGDVKEVVKHVDSMREVNKDYSVKNVTSIKKLDFVHVPIVDCSVTDDNTIFQLCVNLVNRISRGEVLYVHCWGGHGRTGTAICIMLHLMYGMSAKDCMEYCQFVHDLRRIPIDVGSPQTQAQRDQVIRVIEGCIRDKEKKNEQQARAAEREAALQAEIEKSSISALKITSSSVLQPLPQATTSSREKESMEGDVATISATKMVPHAPSVPSSKRQDAKPAKRNLRELKEEAREMRRNSSSSSSSKNNSSNSSSNSSSNNDNNNNNNNNNNKHAGNASNIVAKDTLDMSISANSAQFSSPEKKEKVTVSESDQEVKVIKGVVTVVSKNAEKKPTAAAVQEKQQSDAVDTVEAVAAVVGGMVENVTKSQVGAEEQAAGDVTEIATQMTSDAPSTPNKVDEIMPAKMVTPIKPAGTKKNVGKPSPREGGATIK